MRLHQEAWPTYFGILGKAQGRSLDVEESEMLCRRIDSYGSPETGRGSAKRPLAKRKEKALTSAEKET